MTRLPMAISLTLLALGGCAGGGGHSMSHTDQATAAACRSHASQVYDRNNRGSIYSVDQTGTPYSGSYLAGNQTNTLAEQYANQRMIDDCIRNTGPSDNTVAPDATATSP